jgi:hypothetical protein
MNRDASDYFWRVDDDNQSVFCTLPMFTKILLTHAWIIPNLIFLFCQFCDYQQKYSVILIEIVPYTISTFKYSTNLYAHTVWHYIGWPKINGTHLERKFRLAHKRKIWITGGSIEILLYRVPFILGHSENHIFKILSNVNHLICRLQESAQKNAKHLQNKLPAKIRFLQVYNLQLFAYFLRK